MSPKEKADELVEKYRNVDVNQLEFCWVCPDGAKQCALIAVEELIDEQNSWQNGQVNPVLYWQEVKKEIEKL
jgi:hypothetical protein